MTPKRVRTRKVQIVCHLRPESASDEAVYRETDAGVGFEDEDRADVRLL